MDATQKLTLAVSVLSTFAAVVSALTAAAVKIAQIRNEKRTAAVEAENKLLREQLGACEQKHDTFETRVSALEAAVMPNPDGPAPNAS